MRLENEADPSQIGAGGWSAIAARNDVALKNVHVQPGDGADAVLGFHVVGSTDQDSLTVYQDLSGGSVDIILPIQALPWRDIKLIERNKGARPALGHDHRPDPLRSASHLLEGDKVHDITDIVGAERLLLKDGIATVTMASGGPLRLPYLRLAPAAKMTARIHVRRPKTDDQHRFVHVAQHSGGQLVGGVSLELRPGIQRGSPFAR